MHNRNKILLLFVFLSFSVCPLLAQYANNWIVYNQQYYAVKIYQDGIYRIDSATFANSGIPLNSINPKQFQIFHNGKEIPLYISGGNDGVLNDSDFIEFYGERNDGSFDSVLYGGSANQPNPYYSLFTDTSYYYLTWNNLTNNKRYTLETDTNFSAYTPDNYFLYEDLRAYHNSYYYGKELNSGLIDVDYDETECWARSPMTKGGYKYYYVHSQNPYLSGTSAEVELALLGESDYNSVSPDHHIQIEAGNNHSLVADTTFEGYQKLNFSFPVQLNNLGTDSTLIEVKSIPGLSTTYPNYTDETAVPYVKITYPHTFDMENKNYFPFVLPDQAGQAKAFAHFTDFNGGGNVILYDLTDNERITVARDSTGYKALIPNTGSNKKCLLLAQSQVRNITSLYPVNTATNGLHTFTNFNSIPLDSAYIIITSPKLWQSGEDYKNYRDLRFNAQLININQLYGQFSYGIRKTSLAIRNFINYVYNTHIFKPKYVFLLGKSVEENEIRQDTAYNNMCLVPTFGYPPSDNGILAGLGGTIYEPLVPIGRLSANNNQQVEDYLQKVETYESETNAEWMKKILLFAGGSDATESNTFAGYLNGFGSILEDTSYGGYTQLFQKTSSVPIQTTLADSIKDEIQQGTSLMFFFGHASVGGGFDQNIDDPTTWHNSGKYPFLIGDACYAGNIHLPSTNSPSERMVLLPNEGLIGFLSSVDLGFPSPLNSYTSQLCRNMSQINYGKGIGYQIQQTIKGIEGTGGNPYIKDASLGMTLNGDPAVVIHAFSKPDFMVEASRVFFTPENITTMVDSFYINVVITNLGKAVNGSLSVEIHRLYPQNGKDSLYTLQIPAVKYKDTLKVKMPVDFSNGIGLNTFSIFVDASNTYDELNEFNNNTTVSTLIRAGEIRPIYPYQFAIVPNQGITLYASTGFAFTLPQKYVFQIDTTDLFNSPLMQQQIVDEVGGIISWKPTLLQNMPDSAVYFWRVGIDSTGHNDWQKSSFQYITGKTGWSQYHFFQFGDDNFQFINYDRTNRKFSFINTATQLTCHDIGNPNLSDLGFILYKLDNATEDYNVCGFTPSMHIAVIDSLTLQPWGTYGCEDGTGSCGSCVMINANHQFGNANNNCMNCRSRVENYFIYRVNNAASLDSMKSLLVNHIPDGDYVLAYSAWNPLFSNWDAVDPSIKQTFINMGADTIQNLPDSVPYIFFAKKGHPNSAMEVVGNNKNAQIDLITTLHHNSTFGNIFSTTIGPYDHLDSLYWKRTLSEIPTRDSIGLKLYGVDYNNNEILLDANIPADSNAINISDIPNINNYPYLKLEAQLEDDSLHTAPQLNHWLVTYSPAPEAAVAPKIYASFFKDTLNEGQTGHFSVAVKNISPVDMDSLLIAYTLVNGNGDIINLPSHRYAPLKADSVMISTVDFPTLGLFGNCKILMEVNPNHDQPEEYHFNNYAEKTFYVIDDKQNPLLDVTFDGIHILDNDIVSPKPHIVISLKDENQYLALNDTSDFQVYITYPNGDQKRVYFEENGNQIMQFIPGALPKNKAQILYNPDFLQDGTYTLSVEAKDRSNNQSGNYNYVIDFDVINESTITNVLNYPNPFTTSTRFVFTLTGSKIPDVFKIEIMTITGRVVKIIHKNELGPIHIGRNITQYAWNGTDKYGDRLANGVYFYRVITRINGQKIDHRSTSADKYFKHNIGKMVLFK